MYTLEQLQQKTFGEIKAIGWELNVLPDGDWRFRENWINAIAGVNPPLLQLLEVSPAEVEQAQEPPLESKFGRIVYPRPAQGAISQVVKTSPAVEVDRSQEPISQVAKTSPAASAEKAQEQYPRNARRDCPRCVGIQSLYWTRNFCIEEWVIRCLYCDYERNKYPRFANLEPPVHGPEEYPDKIEALRQASTFQSPPPSYSTPGDCCCTWAPLAVHPTETPPVKTEPKVSQSAIVPVAETSPGVEVDPVEDLPECSECFDDGFIEDELGFIKICQCEPKLSHQNAQREIVRATKISKSDQNPILTGLSLSDRFLARYSPPRSEVFQFQADADGQLTLIDFKVQSAPEPPDPDDFDSLDAFREAIALWDSEHCETNSEHCEHSFVHSETNSVHSEPPDPSDYDSMFAFWAAYDAWDESSDDDSEPLEISLDSFCEWAPCPEDWYEPVALLEQCEVSELSPGCKSSITSDFFIPTFDAWCDLANRQTDTDEPPDTGTFARLRGPKPPKFPPQASQPKSAQVSPSQGGIPKLFHRVAAGSSTQPARSPPGGDA